MGQRQVQRRLAQVSSRLKETEEELRIVGDQLESLVSDADEKSMRALVSETPAAEFEYREARKHADAMQRHHAGLVAARDEMLRTLDSLLDKMKETAR